MIAGGSGNPTRTVRQVQPEAGAPAAHARIRDDGPESYSASESSESAGHRDISETPRMLLHVITCITWTLHVITC
jgi:hypothetical protein